MYVFSIFVIRKVHMREILCDNHTENFRISHIDQITPNDMSHAHIHKEYEIYYLVNGERYYFIEGRTYLVNAGCVVLVKSGDIHRTATVKPDTRHERILLILNEEYLRPVLNALGYSSISTFFRIPVIQLAPPDQKAAQDIFESILYELSQKNAGYEAMIRIRILEFLLICYRSGNNAAALHGHEVRPSTKYTKANEAALYIKAHFTEKISLQDIADDIHVSRGYLSNVFNEVNGIKITEYINVQRINYAKTLLSSSDIAVTELAGRCGYDSITYFERIFKQLVGTSPSNYRKSIGKS